MTEEIQKNCPECLEQGLPDIPMRELQNTRTGGRFLGCTRFPDCKHTEPIPESVRMRRSGAPTLPGFD